jgi:hypothetical protein
MLAIPLASAWLSPAWVLAAIAAGTAGLVVLKSRLRARQPRVQPSVSLG